MTDFEPKTLREIGESEGISPQAVDQIIRTAIKKIKKALEERGINLEDLL
jgi:DNA-directed RNA polymerase specialized sigma subunit